MAKSPYPGFEGSVGPFKGQYGKPHVYARDVHSGAGNCVCGRGPRHSIHPEVAPGFPNLDSVVAEAESYAKREADDDA